MGGGTARWMVLLCDNGLPEGFWQISLQEVGEKLAVLRKTRGGLLLWLEDDLNERAQTTPVKGTFCNWVKVSSVVPKGSVLEPLQFLKPLLMTDLPEGFQPYLNMFANDAETKRKIEYSELSHLTTRLRLQHR